MRGAFDKAEKEVMFTRNPQRKETMSFVKVSLKSFNQSGGNLIEFLAPHVERSIAVIETFMVTFIAETADGTEQPIGSGTFVKTCGSSAIAGSVCSEVSTARFISVALLLRLLRVKNTRKQVRHQ